VFPDAATLAAADPEAIGTLGIVRQRVKALQALATEVAGRPLALHRGAPLQPTLDALRALPGIGDWTAQVIAMRALAWPDAWPASDIGLMNALGTRDPKGITALAEAWRPWRAYAVMKLWHPWRTRHETRPARHRHRSAAMPTSTPAGPDDRAGHRARPGRRCGSTPAARTRRRWPRAVRPGAPAHRRGARWLDAYWAGATHAFTVPLDLHGTRSSARCGSSCCASPSATRSPTARWRRRRQRRRAGHRRGLRRQPGRHDRALPPRGGRQRLADRLCRRAAAQDGAAAARRRTWSHEAARRGRTAAAGRAVGRVLPVHAHRAPEFGAGGAGLRACGRASALLLPLLAWRGEGRRCAPLAAAAVVGLVNTALPFVLFTVAALVLNAGLSGIFNATAPLWGAVVAWAVAEGPADAGARCRAGDRLCRRAVPGLGPASFKPGATASARRWASPPA
jgi:hypothetical protein